MGSHLLPIEQGCHLRLPGHRCVFRLRDTGALGDEGRMLLKCLALADLRHESFALIADCSDVMVLACVGQEPAHGQVQYWCLDR